MNTKSKALIATMVMSVVGWAADQWLFAPSGASDVVLAEATTSGTSVAGAPSSSVKTEDRLIAVRAAVARHIEDLSKHPTLTVRPGEDGFGMPSSWLHAGEYSAEHSQDLLTDAVDPDAPSVTAIMSGVGAVVNGKTVKIGGVVPARPSESNERSVPRATGWTLVRVTTQGAVFRRPDGRLVLIAPPTTKLENGEMSLTPSAQTAVPGQPR